MPVKRMPPELEQELFEGDAAHRRLDRARWVWVVYAALFALSVPWYVPADRSPPIWLGLPHWVILSLGAAVATALFTRYIVRAFWTVEPTSRGPHDPRMTRRDGVTVRRRGRHRDRSLRRSDDRRGLHRETRAQGRLARRFLSRRPRSWAARTLHDPVTPRSTAATRCSAIPGKPIGSGSPGS